MPACRSSACRSSAFGRRTDRGTRSGERCDAKPRGRKFLRLPRREGGGGWAASFHDSGPNFRPRRAEMLCFGEAETRLRPLIAGDPMVPDVTSSRGSPFVPDNPIINSGQKLRVRREPVGRSRGGDFRTAPPPRAAVPPSFIDGTVLKFLDSRVSVGNDDDGVDRSGSSIQVIGTPQLPVHFTSYNDHTRGANSNPIDSTPAPGDWGRDRDPQ